MLDAAVHGPAGLALEGTPGIGKTTVRRWRALASVAIA
jgi:ATP-dependent 26S proteasome regulatory subunit